MNAGRMTSRFSLPVDLLDRIEAEAGRRGITIQDLVDELLLAELPRSLAEATRQRMERSYTKAHAGQPKALAP